MYIETGSSLNDTCYVAVCRSKKKGLTSIKNDSIEARLRRSVLFRIWTRLMMAGLVGSTLYFTLNRGLVLKAQYYCIIYWRSPVMRPPQENVVASYLATFYAGSDKQVERRGHLSIYAQFFGQVLFISELQLVMQGIKISIMVTRILHISIDAS